jgi:hypothetical protein
MNVNIKLEFICNEPNPVVARSKARVSGRSFAGIVGWVPQGHGYLSVSCEFCVMSRRGLCDGLITRPQESYRVCVCVCVCV